MDLTLHADSIFCLLDLKKWLKIGEKQTNEKTVDNVFFLDLEVLFLPFYNSKNVFFLAQLDNIKQSYWEIENAHAWTNLSLQDEPWPSFQL